MRISPFARTYLRRRATALLSDACTIVHPGQTRVTYDPITREATTSNGPVVYTGPCRLWEIPGGSRLDWGGDHVRVTTLALTLPHDAPLPEIHDLVTMTVSEDPAVVGRSLSIDSIVRGGGLRSSRVLGVTFIDSDKEAW